MNKQEIQDELLTFITRHFMVERTDINLENSLIDEGVIDSFGLIEIVTFMETAFGLEVDDEDMNRDNFGSVVKIVAFICRQTIPQAPMSAAP